MFDGAERYEQFMGRWSRRVAERMLEFCALPDQGPFLDVGCGIGSLSLCLARQKPQASIVAVDASAEFIAFASRRNPAPDRIRFEVADARRLSFRDASFGAALSLLVLNFVPDSLQAVREMSRVTRSAGQVSAAVWDYGGRMPMLQAFWDAAAFLDASAIARNEARMSLCRPGELADLWRESGLDDVETASLEISMRFDSFEDYWQPFLQGQGPAGAYAVSLDPERREALRLEVQQRLIHYQEGSGLVLPARAWAVKGKTRRISSSGSVPGRK